jgi:hypothetical protein
VSEHCIGGIHVDVAVDAAVKGDAPRETNGVHARQHRHVVRVQALPAEMGD